jgi:hypothetical protein
MSMSQWSGVKRPRRHSTDGMGRASLGAIRYASTFLRQLPLHPLLAAVLMSLVLGILPMILTAVCSVAFTVLDRCRDTGRPHHHPPAKKSRSVEPINQLELL